MPQLITNWKADYGGADTNTPVEGVSPTVGPELREVKGVIRGETLNKYFYSDLINAFYLSGDDTFYVDDTSLPGVFPTDADILPGETLLVTLNNPDPAEYWAVVKTVTLAAGQVQLSVFTGVHLNGTDGTLSHIRRSIYKVPVHPSSAVDPAYIQTLQDVSSLPARMSCMFGQCTQTNTVFKVAFPFRIPAAYNVRIFGTLIGFTGGTTQGSMRIQTITHDELEATITLHTAPGAAHSVAWLFTMYIE